MEIHSPQLAERLMSDDSIAAVKTVRQIITSVHDHGVVDVFSKFPPQELITSIYALSRLQMANQHYERRHMHLDEHVKDTQLMEDLSRYAPFASAAYGWTMDLAMGRRLHRGDLQALVKMTGIPLEDVVIVNWESRPNRPVC